MLWEEAKVDLRIQDLIFGKGTIVEVYEDKSIIVNFDDNCMAIYYSPEYKNLHLCSSKCNLIR